MWSIVNLNDAADFFPELTPIFWLNLHSNWLFEKRTNAECNLQFDVGFALSQAKQLDRPNKLSLRCISRSVVNFTNIRQAAFVQKDLLWSNELVTKRIRHNLNFFVLVELSTILWVKLNGNYCFKLCLLAYSIFVSSG